MNMNTTTTKSRSPTLSTTTTSLMDHCQVLLDLPSLNQGHGSDEAIQVVMRRPPILRRKGHMQVSRLSDCSSDSDSSSIINSSGPPAVKKSPSPRRPPILRRKGHLQVARLSEYSSDSESIASIRGCCKYVPITQLQPQHVGEGRKAAPSKGLRLGHPRRPYFSSLRNVAPLPASAFSFSSDSDLDSEPESDMDGSSIASAPLPTSATLFDAEHSGFLKSPPYTSSTTSTFVASGMSPRNRIFGPLPYSSSPLSSASPKAPTVEKPVGLSLRGYSLSGEIELQMLLAKSEANQPVKQNRRRSATTWRRNIGGLLSVRRR